MCVCFFVIRIGIRFTLKMQILSEYGIIQDRKGWDRDIKRGVERRVGFPLPHFHSPIQITRP